MKAIGGGRRQEGGSRHTKSWWLFVLASWPFLAAAAGASSALPGFTGALTTPTAFSQAFQSGAVGIAASEGRARSYLNYGAWESGELTLAADARGLHTHAKYTLRPEKPHVPAVAIGGTELLRGSASLYAVAGGNLRVRDGGARLRLTGGVATRGVLSPLFASTEVRLGSVTLLQAEWARWLNVGFRFDPTAQFRLQVGLVHRRPAVGISYDIGL